MYEIKLKMQKQKVCEQEYKLCSPDAVTRFVCDRLGGEPMEAVLAVYMNTKNVPVGYSTIGRGGLAECQLTPRQVYVPALMCNAAAVIIAHNHPSGDTTPSKADVSATTTIRQAGDILGIALLDHLIIGDDVFSFNERGLL